MGNTALLRLLRGCSYNLEQSRGIFIQHIECREKYGLNLARERIVKGTATHLLHMQLTQCLTPLCIASLSLSHTLSHTQGTPCAWNNTNKHCCGKETNSSNSNSNNAAILRPVLPPVLLSVVLLSPHHRRRPSPCIRTTMSLLWRKEWR